MTTTTKRIPAQRGNADGGMRHQVSTGPGLKVADGPDMRASAHAYAAHGWPIFPLSGKVPALPAKQGGRGFKDATTDHDVIDRMWTRFPGANIGLRTGETSRVAVLDVDPRHGGNESLTRIETDRGCLPGTLLSQTGSGGLHFLYRWAPGIGNNAGRWGTGLDGRGEGGYIVAPPSIHPDTGQPYVWAGDWRSELAAWPVDHLPYGREPLARPTNVVPFPRQPGNGTLSGLVRTILEAKEGGRNDALNWSAYKAGQDVTAGRLQLNEVVAALDSAARQIGLTDPEISKTIASALRSAGAA